MAHGKNQYPRASLQPLREMKMLSRSPIFVSLTRGRLMRKGAREKNTSLLRHSFSEDMLLAPSANDL